MNVHTKQTFQYIIFVVMDARTQNVGLAQANLADDGVHE